MAGTASNIPLYYINPIYYEQVVPKERHLCTAHFSYEFSCFKLPWMTQRKFDD